MQFQAAIQSGFRNYATFAGRAPRSEYWYWILFAILVHIVASILDVAVFPYNEVGPFRAITGIVLLLPGIAVAGRRLHDMDHTAWWLLIAPTGIGCFVLLVWSCFKGTDGPNDFGPDPLAGKIAISPRGSV